jgi:hypothetical protein
MIEYNVGKIKKNNPGEPPPGKTKNQLTMKSHDIEIMTKKYYEKCYLLLP